MDRQSMDHGSGQISDGVSILFLIYIVLYHKVYITENCIVSKIIPMRGQLLD